MGKVLGIDLGTTYSAVAVMDETGRPVLVANALGEQTTPSVVLFEVRTGAETPVVGELAKRVAGSRPDDIVQYVKRHLGDSSWIYDSPGGAEYRAEEISAIILRALVSEAEAALGTETRDVVITVPAYFDDARRTATKQAGEIAGLNVLRVLNEPTAAALSYGLDAEDDGYVLVYDLGGGTFDVTILGIANKIFTVLATDGDRNLGGFDWDNALMKLVVTELESTHGVTDFYDDLDAVAELREKCEQAKRALSEAEATSIQVSFRGAHYGVEITREQFEHAARTLLKRTQELVEDTLDESGLEWDDISTVMLVGGSTRMPAVRSLLERLSGQQAVTGVDPDAAVALGAAIQAGLEEPVGERSAQLAGVVIEDVTSIALGSLALDTDNDNRLRNWVIIPKNTKVPASGTEFFSTMHTRSETTVSVTQGDDPDPDFITVIGEGKVLHEEWPAGTDFAVVYRYDIDQTVTVEVYRMPEESYVGTFEIDRPANLSEAQVTESADRLGELPIESPRSPALVAPTLAPAAAPVVSPAAAPLGSPLAAPHTQPAGGVAPGPTGA